MLYLDQEGSTELHGTVLAEDLASFWSTWRVLAFVDLDARAIEMIQAGGFTLEGPLGQAAAALGPAEQAGETT